MLGLIPEEVWPTDNAYACLPKGNKKGTETSIKSNRVKLMGEVGMAVQKSIQTGV